MLTFSSIDVNAKLTLVEHVTGFGVEWTTIVDWEAQ